MINIYVNFENFCVLQERENLGNYFNDNYQLKQNVRNILFLKNLIANTRGKYNFIMVIKYFKDIPFSYNQCSLFCNRYLDDYFNNSNKLFLEIKASMPFYYPYIYVDTSTQYYLISKIKQVKLNNNINDVIRDIDLFFNFNNMPNNKFNRINYPVMSNKFNVINKKMNDKLNKKARPKLNDKNDKDDNKNSNISPFSYIFLIGLVGVISIVTFFLLN